MIIRARNRNGLEILGKQTGQNPSPSPDPGSRTCLHLRHVRLLPLERRTGICAAALQLRQLSLQLGQLAPDTRFCSK